MKEKNKAMLIIILSTLTFTRHTLNRLHLVQVSYFHSRQLTLENPSFPFSFPVILAMHSGIEITGQVGITMLSTQSISHTFNHDDFFFCLTRFPSHSIWELSFVMFTFFIRWKPRNYVQLGLEFVHKGDTKDWCQGPSQFCCWFAENNLKCLKQLTIF